MLKKSFNSFIFLFIPIFIFGNIVGFSGAFFIATTVLAQTTNSGLTPQREAELQAELAQVLQQIADQQAALSTEQQKGASIQRDINILDGQINEAKLKIQAKNLAIASLGKDITQKTTTINQLSDKIDDTQASMAQLIRKTNEIDNFSLADVVLSDQSLSQFFLDTDAIDSIKQSVQTALGVIQQNKSATETARQQLSQQQAEETNAKISIQQEEATIESNQKQKAALLSLSKTQQQNYQSVINQQQAKAAQIRAALFALRDTSSIPFGTALQYANDASKATGIRPAFLLAILTQESNLGQNVGSCYVTNMTTGDGVKVSTGTFVSGVMKPSRDIAPFLRITSAVGRDPAQTRVSCPLGGGGYGGAMGPAQFIPSTWELFEPRLKTNLGIAAPDPWNPKDAFMASAIYLTDLGAAGGSASSERNAACRYYSGRSCDSRKPANAFYGDQVMAKATSIQVNMINVLEGS